MKKLLCVLICAPALLFVGRASTITVFDSITAASSDYAQPVYYSDPGIPYLLTRVYSSFSIASLFTLQNLDIVLTPAATQGTGTVTVNLYSDDGTAPSATPIATLGTVTDAYLFTGTPDSSTATCAAGAGGANNTGGTLETCSFSISQTLAAGRYWIGLDSGYPGTPTTSGAVWTIDATPGQGVDGPGVFGEFYNDSNGYLQANSVGLAIQARLTGTETPEPGTILLAVFGLGAVALLRRRSTI